MDAYEKKELIDRMSKWMCDRYREEDEAEDRYFAELEAEREEREKENK